MKPVAIINQLDLHDTVMVTFYRPEDYYKLNHLLEDCPVMHLADKIAVIVHDPREETR